MSGLLCVGDIMVDVVVALRNEMARGSDSPAEINTSIGGTAVNVACWAAYCGAPVKLVGCVGDDGWDDLIAQHLSEFGVAAQLRRVSDMPTGMVVALAHPDGERSMFPDARANSDLDRTDFVDVWDGISHLYISGYTLLNPATRETALAVMSEARHRGCVVCLDPASASPLEGVPAGELAVWLQSADLVMPNEMEFASLAAIIGETDIGGLGPTFVIKHGAAGAELLWADGRTMHQAAIETSVVDTVGAGDSFAGGLLAALVAGHELPDALATAVAAAAKSVSRRGAEPPPTDLLK